jgi:hypothetical protein
MTGLSRPSPGRSSICGEQSGFPLFLLLDLFSPWRRWDMIQISALLASRKNWNPLLQPASGPERTTSLRLITQGFETFT